MVFYAYGRNIDSPAAVLRTMNDHLIGLLKEERFVTAIYAVADRKSLALTYAAAGHPPPLWLHRRSGIVETLDAGGAMIGVTQEPDFDEHTVHLAPGDTILFYTDGLTEARNRERELFGRQRIAAVLRSQAGAAADSLLNALLDRLHGFRGGQAAEDDTTCIALGIGPPDAPTL